MSALWSPSAERVARSGLADFANRVHERTGVALPELTAWARTDWRAFWGELLAWLDLSVEGEALPVCDGDDLETARFFPRLRLSYPEEVLAAAGSDGAREAIVALDETGKATRLSFGALREQVARTANALAALGVREGDRVVAIARNSAEPIVAALAVASLGAIWSSVAPDLGAEATLRRFQALEPKVLLFHGRTRQHGLERDLVPMVDVIVAGLPTLIAALAFDDSRLPDGRSTDLAALVAGAAPVHTPRRVAFGHPLFILFSSGTTGPPKCIQHGHGGTLLEHLKEHRLHGDLGPSDTLFFMTSCGWMMWNWLVSGLATGARIVVYDGSATWPDARAMLDLVAREAVTVFGTSPAYLQVLRDLRVAPVAAPALREVLSTGSILFDGLYDVAREVFGPVPLQSISGGTDLIGCFVLGRPDRPVYRGEASAVSLGLDVRALGDDGVAREVGSGELVCCNPFPSRPVGFFGDPTGQRFHDAYFAQNAGLWTHGDFLTLTERGTARILGRSDGVLNVRGIRIGPAELYHVLEAIPEVRAALAVDQADTREPGGRRLVLLVVLQDGLTLDRPLTFRIKRELKERASAVHVPAVIVQAPDLPTTFNGKRSERAASDALDGRPVRNLAALRNPELCAWLAAHPELRRP